MRAVTMESFGEPKDVLAAAERPAPEPGAGEVLLELILAPIHNHDLATVRGVYGYRPPLPAIPGTEAVGRVVALGPDVTAVTIGQRVSVSGIHEAWADRFLARADKVVPLPEEVTDETAAQLLAMPLSALMLLEDLRLEAGDRIVVNAANGAIGRLLNVLAPQRGVHVVNLVRGPASVEALTAFGAKTVYDTEAEGWLDQARRDAEDAPIARAVDQIGGPAADHLLSLLAPGGELISFGALSGKPITLNPGPLIFKQAVVKGFWGSRRAENTSPADLGRLIRELVTLAADGTLTLDVEEVYPLDSVAEAVTAAERRGRAAKIALAGPAR
ncbi:zinc-binding dehydrogenase [Nocardia takedensis]|uniref:zinc-binding dehydrogenase n=1 Tax=Nocardia takedensis TaxID=259390 RepID=UPI00031E6873|nr:zinc-binding dehydrogenase [Nocardia takedensis]